MCSTAGGTTRATADLAIEETRGVDLGTESLKRNRFYSSRPGKLPENSRKGDWESVYSCDSAIERVDGEEDDDSDPYDHRTKAYLDTHLEEMGFPGKDPMQLYADSKIAEVLARGTITEEKRKIKLEKLKKALPNRRITTPDIIEANQIIEEIESALEKQKEWATAADAFESIKAMVQKEFNEVSVKFENSSMDFIPEGGDIVETRQLAMEILNAEIEEDEEGAEDELQNFTLFYKSKLLGQQSTQELTNPTIGANGGKTEIAQCQVRNIRSRPEQLKERECPEYPDSEDEIVQTKKMILMFKKRIYKVFQNHANMMKNSKNLMSFELFRIWSKNQEQGLVEMAQDIVRREHDLRVTVKKLLHAERVERMKKAKQKRDASRPVTVPEKLGMKGRTKKAIECIRKREKLLKARQNIFFLSGVVNGKIQCNGTLSKVWSKAPIEPGMPPRPPHGNEQVVGVLNECKESSKRLITYGDMLRLLQQEGDFTPIGNQEVSDPQATYGANIGTPQSEECLRKQIITAFTTENTEVDCPLVTKREFEDHLRILNELFFPEPNFKWIKDTLTLDENAFMCERPESLKMNYSLEELEKDTKKVFGFHGHLSRVVYFFRYHAEYAAVDIQDAYERYVYENNAMDPKSPNHPFGCLLLYSNVAMGIVMIEGQILHVFNHFAGFRYSPIHKMIKTGRVLYVREKVSRHYFRQWVSMVVAPPLGVITYLTKTKKIVNKVAEPRLYHFKEKLERFYRIVSQRKLDETYLDIGENSMFMAPNPIMLFESCCCHQKEEDEQKKELHVPVMDLLPSPALVAYLLKYRQLISFNRFLDEFLMQPELESEDETYNIVENTILSNYVESDEEDEKTIITKEIKKLCRGREILGKLRKDLLDNMVKDTKGKDEPQWTKEYDIHSFDPHLVKVEVKKTEDSSGRAILVEELADTPEETEKSEEERYIDISFEADKLQAQRKFVNFIQTGSEAWQKKIKRFGLPGKAAKEMLRDAQKYKKLRKAMQILAKLKALEKAEFAGEERSLDEAIEEEEIGVGDEESSSTDSGSFHWDSAVPEVPKKEELAEVMGEDLEWPLPAELGQMGEGYEFFGERFLDEYLGEYPTFDWDWKSDVGKPINYLDGDQGNDIPLSESIVAESNVGNPEEEESMPEAPPASSVTHSSTDPH